MVNLALIGLLATVAAKLMLVWILPDRFILGYEQAFRIIGTLTSAMIALPGLIRWFEQHDYRFLLTIVIPLAVVTSSIGNLIAGEWELLALALKLGGALTVVTFGFELIWLAWDGLTGSLNLDTLPPES